MRTCTPHRIAIEQALKDRGCNQVGTVYACLAVLELLARFRLPLVVQHKMRPRDCPLCEAREVILPDCDTAWIEGVCDVMLAHE